ncbi:MAG: hypothetical protein ACO3IM_05515 [Pelagibacteraceae bacterium]
MLIILLACSVAYAMGLIPRTDKHLFRVTKLNELLNVDPEDTVAVCDAIHMVDLKKIKSMDLEDKYFTLGGLKTLREISKADKYNKISPDVCGGLKDGTIVTLDEFIKKLRKFGIESEDVPLDKCEEMVGNIKRYEDTGEKFSVLSDGEIYSQYEMINKIYPKLFSNIDKCPR